MFFGSELAEGSTTLKGKLFYKLFGLYHMGARVRKFYLTQAIKNIKNADTILDAGSGSGCYSFYFSRMFPDSYIVSIDKDSEQILNCKRIQVKLNRNNLEFVQGNLEKYVPLEKFDLIYSIDVLEHIQEDQVVLKNFYRALKPDGVLILHLPRRRQLHRLHFERFKNYLNPDHVRDGYLKEEAITKLEEANFRIEEFKNTCGKFASLSRELQRLVEETGCLRSLIRLFSFPFLITLAYLDTLIVLNDNKAHQGFLIKAVKNKGKTFNLLYFGDHWDEYFRRRQQIAMNLSKFGMIDKIVYIELPLTIISLIKFLFGQSQPKVTMAWRRVLKLGLLSKENEVWLLIPVVFFPYLSVKILQEVNNFIAYWLQLLVLKFYLRKLNLQNNILWISFPLAANFIGRFGEKIVIYDRTEDFAYKHDCRSEFQRLMQENDSKIIKKADIIFVQTREMLDQLSIHKKDIFLIPNAVDTQWFNNRVSEVADFPEIPHPILGYCGNINSRLDFELLEYVVRRHPEWSLVIVGDIGKGVRDLRLLTNYSNVHFLGGKPYRQLMSYLKNFDVCLIPHKIDKFTESQSPLKLFDYLAAGKPIVSTNIAGVRGYENVVKIGNTEERFVSLIEKVLVNDSEEEVEKRKALAWQNTWDRRIEDIFQTLKPYLERI